MSFKSAITNVDYSRFSKQGDIMLAGGVVLILFVMLVPLPTVVLDIMLAFSISFAMVILITSMFMTSPLEFFYFPVSSAYHHAHAPGPERGLNQNYSFTRR